MRNGRFLIVAVALLIAGLCTGQLHAAAPAPDAPGYPDFALKDVPDGTGDYQAVAAPASGTLRLVAVFSVEDAGTPAAAAFSICDGTSCTGLNEVVPFTLSATQSTRWDAPTPWGLPLTGGIFVHRTAGSSRMTIVYRVYR